ncbi:MAG: thioredoxin domain-containing protein, partial [candidate division WOR-3 bacterium]
EALEKEYEGRVEVRSIDVDQNRELASKFRVTAIPTLVFLDAAGNELSRVVGLVPKDTIVSRFKSHGFIQ